MRPLPLIRHWTALLAVPLALWSSLPTVRWCTTDWNEVRVACFLPCVVGVADVNAQCEAEPTCEPSVECSAANRTCEAPAGDPPCDESTEFPCGLAFCLDGPTGGDGVPAEGRGSPHEPPSVFAAILPASAIAPEAPAPRAWALAGHEEPPANPTRARIHQARAPPASV